MRRLGISTGDSMRKFIIGATGKDYLRPEQAKKDREYLRQGKIQETSFYKNASPHQQKVMRSDRDTQRHFGRLYEDMFKK